MAVSPAFSRWDFGHDGPADFRPLESLDEVPQPSDWVTFTMWHIDLALAWRHEQKKSDYIVPPIFDAFPDLRIIRPIQPFWRMKAGEWGPVEMPKMERPQQQAAMFLYGLLPGKEHLRCSCCRAVDGIGPFAECISGEHWTKHACINCYFNGRPHKCTLRIGKHCPCPAPRTLLMEAEFEQKQKEERVKKGSILVGFPEGTERRASMAELSRWHALLVKEQKKRSVILAKEQAEFVNMGE